MRQRTEEEKQEITERLEELYSDKFESVEEVNFRDYNDDGNTGTVTKVVVKSHFESISLSSISSLTTVFGVESLEKDKWELHIKEEPLMSNNEEA